MLRNIKRADLLKYAILILLLPVFLKIADFSRFVILRAQIHELVYGIVRYLLNNYLIATIITVIVIISFSGYIGIKILRRRLYKEFWFLAGLIIFLFQILPMITLRTVKPELFILYLVIFAFVFVFLLLKKTSYDFLRSFSYSVTLLFPVFSLFLAIGFSSSAARPKKTILNGGPEHNLLDERCDRVKLLSQKEITPIWLEEAWLYGGVSTRDGRFIYFSDNGYGVVGFEIKEDGSYEKLPFVKYPKDFNAALYSHRLYLTPDEKYLYYYGARSAEFVFIDRERLEVAYVIPTVNGLDGFSAAMDTKRNLIYGFPFIGKEVPVISYENGIPRLVKWVDFSQVSGWAIQGFYSLTKDVLYIYTTYKFAGFDADSLIPLFNSESGPTVARFSYDGTNERFFGTNFFFGHIVILGSEHIERIPAPVGLLEIFYDEEEKILYGARFDNSEIWVKNLTTNKEKIFYSGPRPRGFLKVKERILFSSGCGINQLIVKF